MDKLIENITAYNLFTNLLPGFVFGHFYEHISGVKLVGDDVVSGIFIYYFIGLLISRIGSLVIAPIISCVAGTEAADYSDYIYASTSDPKLVTLNEVNNTYRSILSAVILSFIYWITQVLVPGEKTIDELGVILIAIATITLLSASYVKQSNFISERVAILLSNDKPPGEV